jgi:uncharacterized protein YlxW (UPF0749 family)
MNPQVLGMLIGMVAVFFGGVIVLTPVLALSVRFAFKPMLESWARIKQSNGEAALQDRRIQVLEAEIQHLQSTVQQLAEAEDFRRQLAAPTPQGVAAAGGHVVSPHLRA